MLHFFLIIVYTYIGRDILKNKILIIVHVGLLFWFFLDMVGVSIFGQTLVEEAFKEDGVFFVIYAILVGLYFYKPKVGYAFLISWLIMWWIIQFVSHWYYTIFGSGEGRIMYFADTIKLIQSTNHYIPDLYHIVVHILILIAFICTIKFYSK